MQVTVVEQGENLCLDAELLGKWVDANLKLQFNVQVWRVLEETLAAQQGEGAAGEQAQKPWQERALSLIHI